MLKKSFLLAVLLALVLSTTPMISLAAETTDPYLGTVVRLEGSDTLYYIAADGKRYVYPNEKTYKSWFTDFSDVQTISAEDLADYPLAGNVRYRPGVMLLKIQTDPKVYAVGQGGVLRWIKTEVLARLLYGDNWNLLIDDVPASFFTNYSIGQDVDDDSDYDADEETEDNDTFEKDRGLHLGVFLRAKIAQTIRCRAVQRLTNILEEQGRNVPRVLERICHDDDDDDDDDDTAPVISNISVTASTTSAVVTWTTNESATSKVKYANEPLATADDKDTVVNNSLVTSHSLNLTGLTASTTYYLIIESRDAEGNKAVSTERTLTTLAAPGTDTVAPVISNISVTASTTSAVVTWTTDETATSKVKYADESLSTATSILQVENSSLVTSHSLNVTGLTASTTYYFMIESKDASNNTVTTTQSSFLTAAITP